MEHTQTQESVVAREVAESELERFLEAMDLKERTDPSRLDAEERKNLTETKEDLIRAIMCGRLVINDDGCAVYTPKLGNTKAITFGEPSGAELMQMDKVKSGHTIAKQNALLGAMSGEGPQRFAVMKQRDLRVCGALLVLFLA